METSSSKNIDLSNYAVKPKINIAVPLDFDRENKKKRIQIAVIVICMIVTAAFWGYYFYQRGDFQNSKNYIEESAVFVPE